MPRPRKLPTEAAGSGALISAEGVAAVTLGGLTLDGQGRYDGLRVEDGARAITVFRTIIHDTQTAIALDGATTHAEVRGIDSDDLPQAEISAEAWICLDKGTRWGGIVGLGWEAVTTSGSRR